MRTHKSKNAATCTISEDRRQSISDPWAVLH